MPLGPKLKQNALSFPPYGESSLLTAPLIRAYAWLSLDSMKPMQICTEPYIRSASVLCPIQFFAIGILGAGHRRHGNSHCSCKLLIIKMFFVVLALLVGRAPRGIGTSPVQSSSGELCPAHLEKSDREENDDPNDSAFSRARNRMAGLSAAMYQRVRLRILPDLPHDPGSNARDSSSTLLFQAGRLP